VQSGRGRGWRSKLITRLYCDQFCMGARDWAPPVLPPPFTHEHPVTES
jgi:hypothetical protein